MMGPASEIPIFLEKIDETVIKNGLLLPATDTIFPVPWATNGKYKVGEVICELTNAETGELLEMNSRTVARKQLERLQSHGLKLMSSFELECIILLKDTLKLNHQPIICMGILPLSEYETLLYDIEQKCFASGIQVENFHCEFDQQQFEFSFAPSYGITCADNMFRFKEGAQNGYTGTFMTKPVAIDSNNGAHFNFSLWTEDKKNAFYDPQGPDKLSETCLYFIGGILHHHNAISALCAPTINCYRRMGQPCVPCRADWEIDHRHVALRVKNDGEDGTYMECRLPSGSSNPYLVMAALMAAGLNGVENKIPAPEKGLGKSSKLVPSSLAEAVTALKNDDTLKAALGAKFVDWFVSCKENYEISRFGSHNMQVIKEKELEMEREEYFYYF